MNSNSGFTIVELLIVVVVIAILAAITIVSYNGITSNARASAVSTGLRQIESSMRLWTLDDSITQWPYDPVTNGGIPLSDLIETYPSLKKYLQKVPSVQGVQTVDWFYDNDRDTKPACGNIYDGVNIVIKYVNDQSLAQKVDDTLDDGNLNCGKVRYGDGIIFFSLSYNHNSDL